MRLLITIISRCFIFRSSAAAYLRKHILHEVSQIFAKFTLKIRKIVGIFESKIIKTMSLSKNYLVLIKEENDRCHPQATSNNQDNKTVYLLYKDNLGLTIIGKQFIWFLAGSVRSNYLIKRQPSWFPWLRWMGIEYHPDGAAPVQCHTHAETHTAVRDFSFNVGQQTRRG